MPVRRHVMFRSDAFYTGEPKPYYINPDCYGDDVARFLMERLKERGLTPDSEPGQEDFGWYFGYRVGGVDYQFVLGFREGEDGESGDWMGTVERAVGFLSSLFGGREKNIQPEALQPLHEVLANASEIRDIRWFDDHDYQHERNPHPTPS